MEDLTNLAVERLGVDREVVETAFGLLLGFLKKKVGDDFDFSAILSKLKGAEKLIQHVEQQQQSERADPGSSSSNKNSGGGIYTFLYALIFQTPIFDIIKKIISMLFGEGAIKMLTTAGDGAEVLAMLEKAGLTTEQTKSIVTMLIDFMKKKVDPETVDNLVEQIPSLKALLVKELIKEE
jgi:ribosomal protein L13E